MRAFNAFQLVVAFVAWPYGIQWLSEATFRGAPVAFYSACVGYAIAAWFMAFAVYNTIGDD